VLKAAFVQGRLSKDEFDLRVGQALASRTFADLAVLTADLPAGLVTARQRCMPARAQARPPVSDRVLSISARGETAAQAERTAQAVADSYVAYVDAVITAGHARAQVLDRAVGATDAPLPARLLVPGGLGALLGALIGAVAALAFSRRDRRSRI